MAAGDNEEDFRNLINNKFGVSCFSGKKNYSLKVNGKDKVSISVDESIEMKDGSVILIEIDSGNAAKILAGQYALLNGLYNGDHAKAIFIVIHYHTDKGRDYNPQRTLKNLYAIQHFSSDGNWIKYNAFHISQIKSIVSKCNNLDDFCCKILPEIDNNA